MKIPIISNGINAIIYSTISYAMQRGWLDTGIDYNLITWITSIAAILTILATVIGLLTQTRAASIREMQAIIDELKAENARIKENFASVSKENIDLRNEIDRFRKMPTLPIRRRRKATK